MASSILLTQKTLWPIDKRVNLGKIELDNLDEFSLSVWIKLGDFYEKANYKHFMRC